MLKGEVHSYLSLLYFDFENCEFLQLSFFSTMPQKALDATSLDSDVILRGELTGKVT